MRSTLDAALGYAALGWRLFPCRPQSKVPATSRGHLDATNDPQQLRQWFGERRGMAAMCAPCAPPQRNIALSCAASGLFVLDVDPRSGGDDSLDGLIESHGALPHTITAITGGGGAHYLFRHPGGKLRGTIGAGLDIKSAGYIIVAPSIHPSGEPYRWAPAASPQDLEVAVAPSWLLELCAQPRGKRLEDGRQSVHTALAPHPRIVSANTKLPRRKAPPLRPEHNHCVLQVLFREARLLGDPLSDGRWLARCPWHKQHTDGRGRGFDTSSVIMPPVDGRYGVFVCSHSHCRNRSFNDVLRVMPKRVVRVAYWSFGYLVPKWLEGEWKGRRAR